MHGHCYILHIIIMSVHTTLEASLLSSGSFEFFLMINAISKGLGSQEERFGVALLSYTNNTRSISLHKNTHCHYHFLPLFSLFSLTSTDAPGHGHIVAIIALQPFVVVTWCRGAAVLVELCSTHFAASALIKHCANPCRARKGFWGAVTHCWAASSHLQGSNREWQSENHFLYICVQKTQQTDWTIWQRS